jgi:hypothetical protein
MVKVAVDPTGDSALFLLSENSPSSSGSHPLFVPDPGHAIAVAIADLCRSHREDFVISASHPSLCMHVPWLRILSWTPPPPI